MLKSLLLCGVFALFGITNAYAGQYTSVHTSSHSLSRSTSGSSGNQTTFNSSGGIPGSAVAGSIGGNVCSAHFGIGVYGGSLLFPIENHQCDVREGALRLRQLGQGAAAVQMLCQDPDMAQALVSTGVKCYVGQYANVNGQVKAIQYRRTR